MSKRIDIEELFRSQLGEAEITPSREAWKSVRRKLRIRKFLRFEPGNFNIWYLGALLVAGTVAVALLAPDRQTDMFNEPEKAPVVRDYSEAMEESAPADTQAPSKKNPGNRSLSDKKSKSVESASVTPPGESPVTTAEEENINVEAEAAETPQDNDGETRPGPGIKPTLVTYFTPSEVSGCAPLEVSFLNTSVNAVSFQWSFGKGGMSEERSPDYIFREPGTYRVLLRAFGEDGNSLSYSEEIEVYPAPQAAFETTQGLGEFDGGSSLEMVNYSTGAVSYRWEMIPTGNTSRTVWSSEEFQPALSSDLIREDQVQIRMVATSFEGCKDTVLASLKNVAGASVPDVKFPTAFGGNHTGPSGGAYGPNEIRSDLFHPHFTELPVKYHLQIFTRMGEEIFETRNVYKGWDGYILQERAAAGVYLWVAEGMWGNGKSFSRKGDVTLLWDDRNRP